MVHGQIAQAPRRTGNTSARTYSPAAQILQEASAARAYLPAGQLKQTAETSNSPSEQAEAAAATRRARQVVFLKNRRAGGRGQKHSLGGTCIGFEYWGAGLTAAEGDAAARRRAAAASSNTHMVELESNNGGTFVSSFWGCQNLKFKTYPLATYPRCWRHRPFSLKRPPICALLTSLA